MTTWITKIDKRAPGAEVPRTDSYIIGADNPNYVMLYECPLVESPSTVVVTFTGAVVGTEVGTAPASANEFRVTYVGRWAGAVEFYPSRAGQTVSIFLKGIGTNVFARDINALQSLKLDRDGSIPVDPTWSNGATTYTAFRIEVTNTASSAGSLLLLATVNGVSKFQVSKDGHVTAVIYEGDGSLLTNLNGSNITTGTVAVARLGTGTFTSAAYLNGAGQFVVPKRRAWFEFSFENGAVGDKQRLTMLEGFTVIGWGISADASSSATFTVKNCAFAGTLASLIGAGTAPSLTSATGNSDLDGTIDWTAATGVAGPMEVELATYTAGSATHVTLALLVEI